MATEWYRHDGNEYVFKFDDDCADNSSDTIAVSAIPVKEYTTSVSGRTEHVELYESSLSVTDSVKFLDLQHAAILGRNTLSLSSVLTVPSEVAGRFVTERLRDQLQFEIENMPNRDLWQKYNGMMHVARDSRVSDATSE